MPSATPRPPADDPNDEHLLLTTTLAAARLQLAEATLAVMRSHGNGPPFIRLGRRVFYRMRDIDQWVESRRVRSTAEGSALPPTSRRRKKSEAA